MIQITSDVQLVDLLQLYDIDVRQAVIPTMQQHKRFKDGVSHTNYVISEGHQEVFYRHLSDKIEHLLKVEPKDTFSNELEKLLKQTKSTIRRTQGKWSKLFAQQRARLIYKNLSYANIIHVKDLVNCQTIPIELLLFIVFNNSPHSYGTLRPIKKKLDKEDLFLIH